MMDDAGDRIVLGWEEWIALPSLGVPAIKAKIDTGAKTSALHAEGIEPYRVGRLEYVRFKIRPAPRRSHICIDCAAPVLDNRSITSSNGIPEDRYIIRTDLTVSGRTWPIEVSLSDRRDMNYRMLLGRQALQSGDTLIDPGASFLQPKLSLKLYPGYARGRAERKV
jgi:ribosomal protein S6--L-glutamate ligase